MSIHANSAAAFKQTQTERGNLETRIMDLMADGAPRTDRQIASELGHTEPLRPRITTLVEDGRLLEVGSTVCTTTQKRVRLTRRFL